MNMVDNENSANKMRKRYSVNVDSEIKLNFSIPNASNISISVIKNYLEQNNIMQIIIMTQMEHNCDQDENVIYFRCVNQQVHNKTANMRQWMDCYL